MTSDEIIGLWMLFLSTIKLSYRFAFKEMNISHNVESLIKSCALSSRSMSFWTPFFA